MSDGVNDVSDIIRSNKMLFAKTIRLAFHDRIFVARDAFDNAILDVPEASRKDVLSELRSEDSLSRSNLWVHKAVAVANFACRGRPQTAHSLWAVSSN